MTHTLARGTTKQLLYATNFQQQMQWCGGLTCRQNGRYAHLTNMISGEKYGAIHD